MICPDLLCMSTMLIFLDPPDDVEDGWYKQLIVDGRSNVTWLVESGGDGAHGIAQVHSPEQEQELSWNKESQTCKRTQYWKFFWMLHIIITILLLLLLISLACIHIQSTMFVT